MAETFATVADHNQMLLALRRRVDEWGTTLESLEIEAGLQSGYAAKLLSKNPIRRASPFIIFLMAEALGLQITLTESPNAERMKQRHSQRRIAKSKPAAAGIPKVIELPPDFMRRIARAGGRARAALPNASELNRQAALARWRKARQSAPA
jgi:hypothetical protein